MRRQHLRDHASLVGLQLGTAHRADLVQPAAAPLQRGIFECNSRPARNEAGVRLAQLRSIDIAVEDAPVRAAGVEPDEPILAEVERLVADAVEAEHAEPGPQEPALAGNANEPKEILRSERRERIVGRGWKQVVIEKSERL